MRSINLVPERYLTVYCQRARLQMWVSVGVVVAAAIGLAALRLGVARTYVGSMTRELGTAQAEHTALLQRVRLAEAAYADLVEDGLALARLRPDHPVPNQLAALFKNAPDGVMFERLAAGPRQPGSGTPKLGGSRQADTAGGLAPDDNQLVLTLEGIALSHRDLESLTEVLADIPQWRRVNLIRAKRQPVLAGEAVGFQLECNDEEGLP